MAGDVRCFDAGGLRQRRCLVVLRRPGRGWIWGYFIPLVVLLTILIAGYCANLNRRLEFQAPFSNLMGGRVVFASLAWVAAMLLTAPLLKLPRARR